MSSINTLIEGMQNTNDPSANAALLADMEMYKQAGEVESSSLLLAIMEHMGHSVPQARRFLAFYRDLSRSNCETDHEYIWFRLLKQDLAANPL